MALKKLKKIDRVPQLPAVNGSGYINSENTIINIIFTITNFDSHGALCLINFCLRHVVHVVHVVP
jgi:hypothetical protein